MKERATLNVPQAAKFLGISRSLTYELVKTGTIPSIRLGEKRIVVPVAALERMLDRAQEHVAK